MSLTLSEARLAYDRADEQRARAAIMREDRRNLKRGEDVEIGPNANRLVITDETTGARYRGKMDGGVFTWELIT